MRKIKLSRGLFALVDNEDYEWLSGWKWHYHGPFPEGYAARWSSRKNDHQYLIWMHKEILGISKKIQGDHRDGNRLNNRRSNLRIATTTQNNRNTAPRNGRKYKGISYDESRELWRASITCLGIFKTIGRFQTPREAAAAYDAEAVQRFGRFARTNFPPRFPRGNSDV